MMMSKQEDYNPTRHKVIVLTSVIFLHAVVIWSSTLLALQSKQGEKPIQGTPAIAVRFIGKSEPSSGGQAPAPKMTAQPQPKVKPEQNQPIEKNPDPKPIIATEKPTTARTVNAVPKPVEQPKAKPQPEAETAPAETSSPIGNPNGRIDGTNTTGNGQGSGTGQGTGKGSGNGQGDGNGQGSGTGGGGGQPMKLSASQITVLSLGRVSYSDRDLQNQARTLVLTVHVDNKGRPTNVRLKKSSGIGYIDDMVIKAVKQAKFKPHVVNGQAVPIVVDYPFQLKLHQR